MCTKQRKAFLKHVTKLDSSRADIVIESGEEYLKNFYGFVFEPSGQPLEQPKPKEEEKEVEVEGEEKEKEKVPKLKEFAGNLPVSKLRHTVKYKWKSSLSKNVDKPFQDSFYEASCVLFNMLIAHSVVIEDLLDNRNRTKECFKKQMKVIGFCEFLEDCYFDDPFSQTEVPFDFQKPCLQALKLMNVGHAQELAIMFTIDKEKQEKLVAMLAKACSNLFIEAFKKIEHSIGGKDSSKELKCFGDYLYLKHKLYEIYTFVYNGVYQNKQEENGKAIRFLRKAKEMLKGIKVDLKKFKNSYWRRSTKDRAEKHVDYVVGSVCRWLENFEKENTLVYHHDIPEELPELQKPHKICKPNKFILPEASSFWKEYVNFEVKNVTKAEKGLDDGKKKKETKTDSNEGGIYERSDKDDKDCVIL